MNPDRANGPGFSMDQDSKMIEAVLRLWDVGIDTQRMSTVLQKPQHEIERALHRGLEDRRKKFLKKKEDEPATENP